MTYRSHSEAYAIQIAANPSGMLIVHTHEDSSQGGTVSHDDLTGVSSDDHHPKLHAHGYPGGVSDGSGDVLLSTQVYTIGVDGLGVKGGNDGAGDWDGGVTTFSRTTKGPTSYRITIPNSSDTMVLLNESQILTFKTFDITSLWGGGYVYAKLQLGLGIGSSVAAPHAGGGYTFLARESISATTYIQELQNADGTIALVGDAPASHGASVHTNRTRNMYIPATAFKAAAGRPSINTRGSSTAKMDVPPSFNFPTSSIGAITTTFMLPEDWAGGAVTVKLYWAPAGTGTATAVMGYRWSALAAGDQIDEAGSGPTNETITPPGTAEQMVVTTFSTTFTPATNGPIKFAIRRDTSNGSDTYGNGIWVIGVELEYTADM